MASVRRRPGRKPHRLYMRVVWTESEELFEPPAPKEIREFLDRLDSAARLIAHGPLTEPVGDFLLFRATDLAEARRALRRDPMAGLSRTSYAIWEWDPQRMGSGVNLEPPPALGAGRLILLQRVSVFVSDRAIAKAWYCDVLGLQVRAEDPSTGHLELALGPGAAALSISVPDRAWGEPLYSETRARIGRATGLVFQTDSIRALALRLEHAHARVTAGPAPEPWGDWSIRFADPDGNEFLAFGPEGRAGPAERRD